MPFLNKLGNFDNMKCGLFHIYHNLPVPVPLRNVRLDVNVVDFVSQVTITQEYVNCESNPIEVCTQLSLNNNNHKYVMLNSSLKK